MAQPAPAPTAVLSPPRFDPVDGNDGVLDPYHIPMLNIFPRRHHTPYDKNNKIMFAAIVSLSVVIAFLILLHLYARYILRRRYRQATALMFDGGEAAASAVQNPFPRKTGLDPTVIASLPICAYKQQGLNDAVECAVCLSLLEEDEMVRCLPNCGHRFHAECVDKWLSCHTTCPICRTEAEPTIRISIQPEPREGPTLTAVEGTDGKVAAATAASSSRMGSFKRMMSRERSSRRIQIEIEDQGLEDLERR
ncbi:E3 ubiquitin-protein ligase ATL41 [Linum perenne]